MLIYILLQAPYLMIYTLSRSRVGWDGAAVAQSCGDVSTDTRSKSWSRVITAHFHIFKYGVKISNLEDYCVANEKIYKEH